MFPEKLPPNILRSIVNSWYESLRDPQRYQEQVVGRLVNEYKKTKYGRRFNASAIGGITDFKKKMKLYSKAPKFIRNIFLCKYKRNPHLRKKMAGTVSITSIGMFGKKLGWGIPIIYHTLVITVGGIGEKPVLINEKIENHEFLSITVSFDHDIVDGAPAARFVSRFTELIESVYGFPQE